MRNRELVTTQSNQVDHFDTAMLEGVHQFATKLSNSALIPAALRGKPADITIVLLTGREVGLSPMMSLQTIDVIKGRQVIEGKALLALIRSNVANPYIKIETKDLVSTVTMARSKSEEDMQESFTAVWDMARAETAGLTFKDNWKNHPAEMLQWRGVAECARIIFPDVSMGLYLKDEVEHLDADTVTDGLTESETNTELIDVEPIDVTSIETVADELVDSVKKPEVVGPGVTKVEFTGEAASEPIVEKTTEAVLAKQQKAREVEADKLKKAEEKAEKSAAKAKASAEARLNKAKKDADKRNAKADTALKAKQSKEEKIATEQAETVNNALAQSEEAESPGTFIVNVGKYEGRTLDDLDMEMGPQELEAMLVKIEAAIKKIESLSAPKKLDLEMKEKVATLKEGIVNFQAWTKEQQL